jgi:hypothetical protein
MSLPAVQIPMVASEDLAADADTPTRRRGKGKAGGKLPVRPKVTTVATEIASKGRRTNKGTFLCPGEWDSLRTFSKLMSDSTGLWQYIHEVCGSFRSIDWG